MKDFTQIVADLITTGSQGDYWGNVKIPTLTRMQAFIALAFRGQIAYKKTIA